MSKAKLNVRIIQAIKENTKGDKVVENFLIDLLYEEASNPGMHFWKDRYKNKIDEAIKEMGEKDEN